MTRILLYMLIAAVPFFAHGQEAEFRPVTPDLLHLNDGNVKMSAGRVKRALSYYERAAEWGNKEAQKLIGLIYFRGNRVPKDNIMACAWLKLAASTGDQRVTSANRELKHSLDTEQQVLMEDAFQSLQERYSDERALARREKWVRKTKREATGSRTGNMGGVRVTAVNTEGRELLVTPVEYYRALEQWVT